MLKVFLVDDEIAIRESIRGSFPWEERGFTLVGEAPDGEIALPMIQDERPDILITDIRMPFMDGMELCAQVSRQMPWVSILILSGYDDFNYARQAMSLGVKEYLLKPVSATDLGEALDRAAQRIRQTRTERENLEKMQRRFLYGNRFLKEKLLAGILTEPADEKSGRKLLEQLRALGINLVANRYAVIDLAYTPASGDRTAERDALFHLSESSGGTVHVCDSKHGTFALVLGDNDKDIEERAYAFARSALGELERMDCKGLLASVGEGVDEFARVAHSAGVARHIRHVISARGDRATRIADSRDLTEDAPAAPDLDVRPLFERLQYADMDSVTGILADYVRSLGAADIHTSVAADYFHVEVMMTASRIVREAGGTAKADLDTESFERRLLLSDEDVESDLPAATDLICRAIRYRDSHSTAQGGTPIAQARAYLAEHFSDPNLMLQDVAGYVGMSNSRFSTVFAQKMGLTFTEYLSALRLGKAKELLRATDMRSSQIAFAVGYNDPHYFSYLFRKSEGVTPSEYRKGDAGGDNS